MDCEGIRDLLPLYAGDEVEENERIAVDSHLGFCPDCTRELDEYRDSRNLLATIREPEPPSGLWKEVRAQLFPRRETRLVWIDWALRYAAILVIGLAVGFLSITLTRTETPAPGKETPKTSVAPMATTDGPAFTGPARGGADFAGDGRDNGWNFRGRHVMPRGRLPEGNHYLPRVDSVLSGAEKDF